MKKKLLCMMLSIAVIFSFMPIFTIQADAFSTGAKTLIKTKTVTVKPGKTYKSPSFKLSKKMAIQIPLKIKPAGKIKDSDYEYKLKYTLSVKTAKGKTKASFKCPAQGICNVFTDKLLYEDWIYFYNNTISKPGFAKGKYYITFKNTTKRSIKVTYSVKGYTKFATAADLSKSITMDYDEFYVKAGRIGPGIPAIKSIKSSNKNVGVDWIISNDGKLTLLPYAKDNEEYNTVVTVTLKTNKKFKIKLKLLAEPPEEDE